MFQALFQCMTGTNPNQKAIEVSGKSPSYRPGDIAWTEEEIKLSRSMAVKHINIEKNSYESESVYNGGTTQFLNLQVDQSNMCGPSCTHDHAHNFEYDFTKNFQDALDERPGIDFVMGPKIDMEAAKNPSMPCEFGLK